MLIRASTLYIVATPIGNLDDISARAINVLKAVDMVFAEDTRRSGRLLKSLGLNKPLRSLHEHNEDARLSQVEQLLTEGGSAALISDAGTPLISDPGYRLVAHCHDKGIAVSPIPGASALIAALSVCGLPTDSFIFLGFTPVRQAARLASFKQLALETRTLVFYESRHRILASVKDMIDAFGADRLVTIARELTKTYETLKRAPLAQLLPWLEQDTAQQKGEFVVIVQGAAAVKHSSVGAEVEPILRVLLREMPVKQAAALAAEITGCKRKIAYSLALSLRSDQ